jgi:ABC-type phosphate transport system substrate-binding protein
MALASARGGKIEGASEQRSGAGRRRWTRRARRTGMLLVAGAFASVAGGCGVSLQGTTHNSGTSTLVASVSSVGHLPPRPQGEVQVSGGTRGSLTAAAAAAYEGSGARIAVSGQGEARGFSAMCRGRTDIVDSRKPISQAELSVCQAYGVQPVQIEVAADGAVLATGGEVDVGADCLTSAQVKQVFKAGSQIVNWAQLGYYDIPLRMAGPQEGQGAFDLFGETALGSEAPTLASLRGDYEALSSEAAVRNAVTGGGPGATSAQLHSQALTSLAALHRAIGQAHGFIGSASFQVAKGARDKRPARTQARDRATLEHAKANLGALLGDVPAAERYVHQTSLATARFEKGLGTLGYFSLAYYEAHQSELRPLEIDSGARRPELNCIFPSAETIGDGSYPLSSQFLLTVSLQDMRRQEVTGFLRFYLAQAQSLASNAGLVPLPNATIDTEASWLEGRRQPPIVSYAAPGGAVGGGSQGTSASASGTPNALAPAGGAGAGVSSADVPTGGGTVSPKSGEASGGGEGAQPGVTPQSSQPLTAGQ